MCTFIYKIILCTTFQHRIRRPGASLDRSIRRKKQLWLWSLEQLHPSLENRISAHLYIFLLKKLSILVVYNTVYIQKCYSNRVNIHGYCSFLFDYLNISSLSSLTATLSALTLFFSSLTQFDIEKGGRRESI